MKLPCEKQENYEKGRWKMWRPGCLSDTKIVCKDGCLYGERSLLYRLSEDFAQQLSEPEDSRYLLRLPEEMCSEVNLFWRVLQYYLENGHLLRGPSRSAFRRSGFPLQGSERQPFLEFCFRNYLGQATLPLIYRPKDASELQCLLQLVYQNPEQFDDSDEQYQEVIGTLLRRFIRRAEKGHVFAESTWALVWESMMEPEYLHSEKDWQSRFLRTLPPTYPRKILREVTVRKFLRSEAARLLFGLKPEEVDQETG